MSDSYSCWLWKVILYWNFPRYNLSNAAEPSFRFDPYRVIFSKFRNSSESDILRVSVFAQNQKGRSQGVFITEYHLGNFKQTQKDLRQHSSPSSPLLLGTFFTILFIALTIIGREYWKSSRRKQKEIVKEEKYNMESRCSLLKQDNFAVSQPDFYFDLLLYRFEPFYPPRYNSFSMYSRMLSRVRNLSRRVRVSRREEKLRR